MRKGHGAVRLTDLSLLGLVALVALVGVLAAFSVRLFESGVDGLLELGYIHFPELLSGLGMPVWLSFLLFPVSLGLVVSGLKRLVPGPDRHHSVPLVILSMNKRDGLIKPITTLLKTASSMVTLGAGGSLGREGPVVLLGGGIGSSIGQVLRLPPDWVNTLVVAGAGAAIATAFHAPITGAFFAMEIVLIQFSARSFALVALACLAATQFSGLLEGTTPFPIPAYSMKSPWEIPLVLVLGLLTAPLARIYIRVLYGSESLASRLTWLPEWLRPPLGGLLFGAVAIALPGTLAGGYETITDALAGRLTLGLLLLLLLGKLLTIGLTSGGGWPGGVFTPALFLGSMAGGAYGQIVAALFPNLVPQPGAYAVVGMAAMVAGATHAPLTAMTLIFEITQDYRIALPAMLACGVAAVFSQRFSPYSVDTIHLAEHGVLLPWQVHDLRGVRVSDAMTRDVHAVFADMQLKDVIAVMQFHRHGGYPVLDQMGRLVGIVTLRDVREVPLERRLTTPVTSIMSKSLVITTPDETLAGAALLMAREGIGRVPVVDADDQTKLLGIISRSDVLRNYPGEREPEDEAFLER